MLPSTSFAPLFASQALRVPEGGTERSSRPPASQGDSPVASLWGHSFFYLGVGVDSSRTGRFMVSRAFPGARRPTTELAAAQRRRGPLIRWHSAASAPPRARLPFPGVLSQGTSVSAPWPIGSGRDRRPHQRLRWALPLRGRVLHYPSPRGVGSGSQVAGNAWATCAIPRALAKRMRNGGRADCPEVRSSRASEGASRPLPELASSSEACATCAGRCDSSASPGGSHCALPRE